MEMILKTHELAFYAMKLKIFIFISELIDNVVAVAEHTADELIRTDGREVRLDEDEELQLPFLLPEDGYSCDVIRGVPQGLQEFLQLLIETGMFGFRCISLLCCC